MCNFKDAAKTSSGSDSSRKPALWWWEFDDFDGRRKQMVTNACNLVEILLGIVDYVAVVRHFSMARNEVD